MLIGYEWGFWLEDGNKVSLERLDVILEIRSKASS